ncbi:MAG: HlyD family efflux transporter periplasmic adaptor subunit, partial [Bacteroidales bacterium]|nr:HlyD family efflux transporter periplasmic adaptor subunit [Bacteroidales bacterium]
AINYINIVNGQYIEPNIKLIEIIDINKLELKLSAFEKDLQFLEENQEIEYYTLSNPNDINTAHVSKIGKSINPNTGAIDVYAKPDEIVKTKAVNSAAIEALVNTDSRSVKALPETAVVKSENKYFIYVLNNYNEETYYLDKVEVSIGQTYNGFVEIINPPQAEKIIINGLDNLSIE